MSKEIASSACLTLGSYWRNVTHNFVGAPVDLARKETEAEDGYE